MPQNRETKLYNVLLSVCVIEMLVFSGEMRLSQSILGNRIQLPLYCASALFLFLNSKRIDYILSKNLKIYVIIIAFVFISSFIVNTYANDFSWVRYTLFPLGTLLILSASDYYVFRERILKFLSILSIISIAIHLCHQYYGLFPAKLYQIEEGAWRLSLGFFNTEWGENRLASIYWEPGQYQIVIIFVLCMFLDELCNLGNLKKNVAKFGVLIVSLILTISTTGYLAFGILLIGVMLNSRFNRIKYTYKVLYFIVTMGIVASAFIIGLSSRAIEEKIAQSESRDLSSSYFIRVNDNIALLRCIEEKPVWGFGAGSPEFKRKVFRYGSRSNSNGWLKTTAQLGVLYSFFIVICIWLTFKSRFKLGIKGLIFFLVLLVSQSNEPNLFYPYIYIYIFRFANEKRMCAD